MAARLLGPVCLSVCIYHLFFSVAYVQLFGKLGNSSSEAFSNVLVYVCKTERWWRERERSVGALSTISEVVVGTTGQLHSESA